MRKHVSKPKKPKAVLSLKKILNISVIIFILAGMMGVMASNEQMRNVKIILSSGYEMNVVTKNTKVEDILNENKIIVMDTETVMPALSDEITDNKTITIVKGEKQEVAVASYISEEEILNSYTTIVEKIITLEEEIPFETITQDVSNGTQTQDKVVQVGENGLKKTTYSVKFQNGNEIEKNVIEEEIIKEPVDKIVEVRTATVTSRGSERSTGSELETIWAIVRQEGGSSYESALAVASTAVNRINSNSWSSKGSTMYAQLTAKGQYCYSIDRYWVKYLGGNVPDYVKQAVSDAMDGKTNHPYTCFRNYYTKGSVKIGGNYYFGS